MDVWRHKVVGDGVVVDFHGSDISKSAAGEARGRGGGAGGAARTPKEVAHQVRGDYGLTGAGVDRGRKFKGAGVDLFVRHGQGRGDLGEEMTTPVPELEPGANHPDGPDTRRPGGPGFL